MRLVSLILGLVLLGGCQKGADAPEVVLISAEVGVEAPPDTTPAVAPDVGVAAPDTTAAAPETAAPAPDAAALREKLLALAVASECLRKGGTPPEQSAQTMLALYKAHGVDLDTYTREMSRLAGDPTFQAEIDAKTGDCPTAPIGAPDAAVAEIVADTAAATPDATTAAVDAGPTVDSAPAGAVDAKTEAVVDTKTEAIAETKTEAIVDTKTEAIVDTKTEAIVDTKSAVEVAEPEVEFSGTWTGQLYGGPSPGNLRVTIKGRTVTSAVATFGRISLRLKGSISEKGAFNVGGTSGKDFIRVGGQAHKNGRVINGTWDGVIDRKKADGRVQLKR